MTQRAGQELGRRVYAMEIAPAYVDVAVQWWQERFGLEAVLEGTGEPFVEVAHERDLPHEPPSLENNPNPTLKG